VVRTGPHGAGKVGRKKVTASRHEHDERPRSVVESAGPWRPPPHGPGT
jgi:hypothetical protein